MKPIAKSELILNKRGSVYHLDIRLEEIAPLIILVGDPDRVPAVSKYFDRIEFKLQNREFLTQTGYIGAKRISVVSTGIGTDNIDIVLNELDALFNIDFESREVKKELTSLQFIRAGTSGSLQEDVPINSLLVSSYAIGLDNLLNFYELNPTEEEKELQQQFCDYMQLENGMAKPSVSSGSEVLRSHFSSLPQGITVTCPGFYAPQGRVLRAVLSDQGMINRISGFSFRNHRVTNFEMETAGIYGLSKILGHEAISISAILANRVTGQFSNDSKRVVDGMIQDILTQIQ